MVKATAELARARALSLETWYLLAAFEELLVVGTCYLVLGANQQEAVISLESIHAQKRLLHWARAMAHLITALKHRYRRYLHSTVVFAVVRAMKHRPQPLSVNENPMTTFRIAFTRSSQHRSNHAE